MKVLIGWPLEQTVRFVESTLRLGGGADFSTPSPPCRAMDGAYDIRKYYEVIAVRRARTISIACNKAINALRYPGSVL